MHQISEHKKLPDELNPNSFNEKWQGGLCLNPNAKEFDKRYLFVWDKQYPTNEWNYHATYTIGTWWLPKEKDVALSVTTDKLEKVDFLKMFTVCLESGLDAEGVSKIYGIDTKSKPIQINKWDSVLSPLIITHFLSILRKLVSKGLKRSYVYEESNLRKLRGKLQLFPNQNINVNPRRLDRFYCSYQEHTVDTSENRVLKKALLFSERVLTRMIASSTSEKLKQTIRFCKSAFHEVGDNIGNISSIRHVKANKLYREYGEAIRLAKVILRHYDFSITKVDAEQDYVPPFWIDMPLLYEHYVLGLLKQAYGNKIVYQYRGATGRPDFLYIDKEKPLILDTKYIDLQDKNTKDIDIHIVRQLSGYSRDSKIRSALGVTPEKVIPCVYIFPSTSDNSISDFKGQEILERANKLSDLLEFYKIGVRIPTIQ